MYISVLVVKSFWLPRSPQCKIVEIENRQLSSVGIALVCLSKCSRLVRYCDRRYRSVVCPSVPLVLQRLDGIRRRHLMGRNTCMAPSNYRHGSRPPRKVENSESKLPVQIVAKPLQTTKWPYLADHWRPHTTFRPVPKWGPTSPSPEITFF